MRSWLWLMTLALATGACADKTDDIVKAEMAKFHVPGLSLAVVRDGKVIKAAGYGFANLEWKVPAAPDTVYQLQSVTKQFTAVAVMMLVEEGKLALDDPVGKYLNGAPESWKPITVRSLLNHTSGIKDFINEATQSLRLEVTEEDVLKATAPRPLNFEPGTKFEYSNTNYHLLAMIIRKLTGKSWGEFVMERICRPLGMTDTRVYSQSALIPRRASGYLWKPAPPPPGGGGGYATGSYVPPPPGGGTNINGEFIAESVLAYAGGGLCSTVLDMAKWDAALYTEKLVKKASLEQMWTPAVLKGGGRSDYGMGWSISRFTGHRVLAHSGGHFTGFTTVIMRWPEDKLTVIVLTNLRGGHDPGRLAQQVAALYEPALAPTQYKPIADKEPGVTARLRRIMQDAARGKADKSLFAPGMQALLTPASVKQIRAGIAALGTFRSISLLERADQSGNRVYRYRVSYANGSMMVLMVIDAADKIAGFEIHGE